MSNGSNLCIPATLVASQMRNLATLPHMGSTTLRAQVVLLPRRARDMTEDMPLGDYKVLEVPEVEVCKYCKDRSPKYRMLGPQLRGLRPVKEGWWLTCEPS
jgi:hypothetical protein